MGAFNAWTAGSFLAEPANREVAQVARNLLEGAAAARARPVPHVRCSGTTGGFPHRPRPLE